VSFAPLRCSLRALSRSLASSAVFGCDREPGPTDLLGNPVLACFLVACLFASEVMAEESVCVECSALAFSFFCCLCGTSADPTDDGVSTHTGVQQAARGRQVAQRQQQEAEWSEGDRCCTDLGCWDRRGVSEQNNIRTNAIIIRTHTCTTIFKLYIYTNDRTIEGVDLGAPRKVCSLPASLCLDSCCGSSRSSHQSSE
jgi:hypothetical protein